MTTLKGGHRVKCANREGVFEVVFVNALMQTANIRLVDGTARVVPNVPWTALTLSTRNQPELVCSFESLLGIVGISTARGRESSMMLSVIRPVSRSESAFKTPTPVRTLV